MAERSTWPPYSKDETDQIRAALITPNVPIVCPRCGKHLDKMGPIISGGFVVALWQLRCLACQRTMIARDLPEHRKSSER